MKDYKQISDIETELVKTEVNKIISLELDGYTERQSLEFALNIIDLTTLEGSDTDNRVIALCEKALKLKDKGLPSVAAVCVYPPFVKLAKQVLAHSGIHVASVAGAFPSGQSPLHVKLEEIKFAVNEGADEIDMVISRGKFLEGKYSQIFEEVSAIKAICKDAHLKVILETGELGSLTNVRIASEIAMNAGADFIKTSTGKISPAATEEAVYVMLQAIKDFYNETGRKIGIKPAGGISEPEKAMNYIKLVNSILGKEWMTNELFRIGASRLVDKLEEKLLA
jgi:deoxyribose-phosphate aldolase